MATLAPRTLRRAAHLMQSNIPTIDAPGDEVPRVSGSADEASESI